MVTTRSELQDKDLFQGLRRLSELPDWLRRALDAGRVAEAVQQQVPEFASGSISIRKCKVKRLFLKDTSGRWVGTYTLTVQMPPSDQEQTLQLRGTLTAPPWTRGSGDPQSEIGFGSPGWHTYLPDLGLFLEMEPPESELPSMPVLTDPEQARLMLEGALQAGDPMYRDLHIQACNIKILSYKPGSRCTILYTIHYIDGEGADPSWPRTVIAKTYRKASKAQNAYEGMLALWRSPLRFGEQVTLAEPLAFIPEHKVMLQRSIPGETSLEDLLELALHEGPSGPWDEVHKYLRKSAVGLAAVHGSGIRYGEAIPWDKRSQEIPELLGRLAAAFPDLVALVMPAHERLLVYAAEHPADPAVPTHGTFNPEQVLIDGEKIGFIDFDDVCMAEPAMDVGLFCSAIEDTGLNALDTADVTAARPDRYALLDRLGEIFISQYESVASISRPRVALWQALDFLRSSLHYWIKAKPAEPDNALFMLEQQLKAMGLS